MTVATTISEEVFPCNGVQTVFSVAFSVAEENDVFVLVRSGQVETLQTLNVNYTLSGIGGPSGFTVTMSVPPANGEKLIVYRLTNREQDVLLSETGGFNLTGIMSALDRQARLTQEVLSAVDRSIRLKIGEVPIEEIFLGSYEDRAGKVLTFSSNGQTIVLGPSTAEILAAEQAAQDAVQAASDSAAASALSAGSAFSSEQAAAASAVDAAASLENTLAIADSLPSWRGNWLTGTAYQLGDLVQTGGSSYICVIAHTSGTFSTDLSALRWALFAAQGAAGAGTGDLVAAQNLNDVSDKSAARQNLQVVHYVASASAPVSPMARMLWRDTSVSPSRLYVRNDDNDGWVVFDPVYLGFGTAVSSLISNLDTHALGGVFRSNSGATGNPLAGEGFRFAHWPAADGTAATQIAQGVTSGRTFIRNRTSSAWGDWTEFLSLALGGQLAAGITATNDGDGTFSSGTYTPTPVGGNFKSITNAGAFTIAAPTASGVYTLVIEVTNTSGAGAITMSGFARVVGDVFTTISGNRFQIFVAKTQNGVTASVVAMQ